MVRTVWVRYHWIHQSLALVWRQNLADCAAPGSRSVSRSDWNIRNNPGPRQWDGGEQCERSVFRPTQSRSEYCVSDPNQPLSIQLFVIIIEKGVKGFTQLTVIPLAYASHGIWQGSRYFLPMIPRIIDRMTEPDQFLHASLCNKVLTQDTFTYSCSHSLHLCYGGPWIPFISVYRTPHSLTPGFELLKLVHVH